MSRDVLTTPRVCSWKLSTSASMLSLTRKQNKWSADVAS